LQNRDEKTQSSSFYPRSEVATFLNGIASFVELSLHLRPPGSEGEFGLEDIHSMDIRGHGQQGKPDYVQHIVRSNFVMIFLKAIQDRELKALKTMKFNDIELDSKFPPLLTNFGLNALSVTNCNFSSEPSISHLNTLKELYITVEGGRNISLDWVPVTLEKFVYRRYRQQNREGTTNFDARECKSLKYM
jgi:hypothetical protein